MIQYIPVSFTLLIGVFSLAYFLILFEHVMKINKAAAALIGGTLLWALYFGFSSLPIDQKTHILGEHIFATSQVVFFLIGAMAIVEVIEIHQGFSMVTNLVSARSKVSMLWIVGFLSFFLSAILDNLTTTIIIVTLLKKLLNKKEDRLIFGAIAVIAANAGGAWTPIGDVTTTMLWIGGQLETMPLMSHLFIPSLMTLLACLGLTSWMFKGQTQESWQKEEEKPVPYGKLVTFLGISALLCVPVLKSLLGLPPFINVFIGLGALWVIVDILHSKDDKRQKYRACRALARVDFSTVIFFLGILLAVSALESAGVLALFAEKLAAWLPSSSLLAFSLGAISSFLDNVPLVAAIMGMYDLAAYPPNHSFWELIAFCAGTGGSITVIGSAAGIAYMGMESVSFGWYLKKVTPIAIVAYVVGFACYFLQGVLF